MALRTPSKGDEETSYGAPNQTPNGVSAEELERIPTASQEGIDHLRSSHRPGMVYKPLGSEGVYDQDKPSTPTGSVNHNPVDRASESKKINSETLGERERSGDTAKTGFAGQDETASLGFGTNDSETNGLFSGNEDESRFGKFRGKFTRRKTIIGGLLGAVVTGGVFGFSIIQGPLQFIHLAQSLQNFHMKSNNDFSNRRSIKLLQYVLSDDRAERTRLGVATNAVADKWEARITKDTGLRPVYTKTTGRFAGFEIVDRDKAQSIISEWEANNGKVTQVSQAGGQGVQGTKKNRAVSDDHFFLDARDSNPRATRAMVNSVSKSTKTFNIAGTLGARLLKKRGGVDFAPLKNKSREKLDSAAAKRAEKQRIKEETAKRDKTGVEPAEAGRVDPIGKDADGNDVVDPTAEVASKEAKEAIDKANQELSTPGEKSSMTIRQGLVKGLGVTAAVGVLCTVKGFGDNIEDYKYVNNVAPMIRMGMRAMTIGNQVMSGNNVNPDELSAFYDSFYDPETKTSWANASTMQAEFGQKRTGPDVPSEASLKNIGSKPEVFNAVDSIPGISSACGAMDFVAKIPVLQHASKFVSDATALIADTGLSAFGTSTADLMERALAAASGNSVNVYATGAEWGNLVNVGAFMAGNDDAISGGGGRLTSQQTAEIKQMQFEDQLYDNSKKSFYARYLDVYDSTSLASTAIGRTPSSFAQASQSFTNPIKTVGSLFSGSVSNFMPRAYAQGFADPESVYGVPKYGFSNELESSPVFDNPIDGALKVEAEIDNLNEKYSECFNMKVNLTDNGPRLESTDKTVNTFQLEKKSELKEKCDPNINRDNLFNQYRFYINDVKNSTALNCYEGNEDACGDLGVGGSTGVSSQASAGTSTTEEVDGDFKINKIKPVLKGASSGGNIDPKGITLHWWGGQFDKGIDGLVSIFKSNGLSVQIGITSDGGVYQLTESLTTKTSHAIGANSSTIGIEIEGGPEQFGKEGIEKYPEKFNAVVNTVKYLVKKYNIPLEKNIDCNNVSGVITHKDLNKCSPIGKSDIDDYYYNEVMKKVRGE